MLQKIRDRIQGWFAGVIIAIIAGAFMLFGIESYIGGGANDSSTIATIDGEKITERQLNQAYQSLKRNQQLAQGGATLSAPARQQLKQIALQNIISNTALSNAATDAGFHVGLAQVEQLLLRVPEFQVKGQFSSQRFQQLMYANQTTEAQFLNQTRTRLLINQVALGIQNSDFVLPEELKSAYQLMYQKRSFGYFIVPITMFQSGITISKQEISNYYKQYAYQYKTPEKVKISYVLLSPKSLEKNIHIKPAQIRSYYQSNKAQYSEPKRWKIARITIALPTGASQKVTAAATKSMQKIQAQLTKGIRFSTLMKQTTNQQTATTQWINENQVSATLSNVLSTLHPKQISKPFHTPNGINIVQLLGENPASTKSFEAVKTKIKHALIQQHVAQLLLSKTEQLSNLSYTNPGTLHIAAKTLGLSVQTTPWTTREGAKSGVLSNPAVLAIAFSNEVLKDGNNSNPITLKNDTIIVLRINKHLPQSTRSLSSVSQQIKQQLIRKKREAKAGLKAYEISSALGKGSAPQALATQYGLKWVSKQQIPRQDKTVPAPILEAVFSTIPAEGKKSSGINSLLLANGNYIVIKVFKYKNGDSSKAPKNLKKALTKELAKLRGQITYKFYARAVIDHAKIDIKNTSK